MRLNGQQLVDRTRRKLGELAGTQQGTYWTDQHLLECIELAQDDLVVAAIEAAQDYFTEVVEQNLVAGQDTYPLIDGFIRLRLVERQAVGEDAIPYIHSPKFEGVGQSQSTVVEGTSGGYALRGDNIELNDVPEQTITNGLVQHVVLEPPPPMLGLVASGAASSFVLAAGGTATSPSEPPIEDDYLNGTLVEIVAGTGIGQRRKITDYAGTTKQATVGVAWTTVPDLTSKYATISRLPRQFHNMLVIGGALHARHDRDEDAGGLISIWNSKLEDFIAFVEERTLSQQAVPVFDAFDGLAVILAAGLCVGRAIMAH